MPEIHLYSMSHGVYEDAGNALPVSYGIVDTPQGKAFISESCGRIIYFSLTDDEESALSDFKKSWYQTKPRHRPEHCQRIADSIFKCSASGKKEDDSCARLLVLGTDFQISVWQQLAHIEEGTVTTYKDIAEKINQPDAVLAVATAVGENPIAYLLPCHRVVRTDGALGKYRWGEESKRTFLSQEGYDLNQLTTA